MLGPVGTGIRTDPPARAAVDGTVVDGTVVVLGEWGRVVEGCDVVDRRPVADGELGEFEHAAATTTIAPRNTAKLTVRRSRTGFTAWRLS